MTGTALFLTILFGSIGTGFIVYGRKQRKLIPLLCGIALLAEPLLIRGAFWLTTISLLLCAVPFVISSD